MTIYKDATAVITGASSGIGRSFAEQLAQPGRTLHLIGRDEDRLAEVVEICERAGATAHGHAAEITDDSTCAELIDTLKRLKRIDLLVHSAGVVTLSPVVSARIADLDLNYRVNLRAPYQLTSGLLPEVIAAKGQIAFVNSGAGLNARAGWSQYAASKHGLRALADSLREEVKPVGVRVMSVYPGRTATPMQVQVRKLEDRPYVPEELIQPKDVSDMMLHALGLPRTADVVDINVRPGR